MAKPGERKHFKAPDLKRLLKTLKEVGMRVSRIDVENGRISVIPADDDAPAADASKWDAAPGAAR
jgi:hypothetical protein